MAHQRKVAAVVSLGVILVFARCQKTVSRPAEMPTGSRPVQDLGAAKQSVERAQTTLREVTDVFVRQAAAQNALGKNDPAVSDAIREYEALRPEDRVKYIVTSDRFRNIFSRIWEELPAPQETRHTGTVRPGVHRDRPEDFDLDIRKSDVFAQQVRLTNALFKDADPKVLSAIDAWEKMTPVQKKAFVATPENTAYYWNYVYLTYKIQLLRYYYVYTRECYWGYRTPKEIQTFDPKQFDLQNGGAVR